MLLNTCQSQFPEILGYLLSRRLVLNLLLCLNAIQLIACEAGASKTLKREFVALEALPPRITELTFPHIDEPKTCDDLIGCVRNQLSIPLLKPNRPEDIKPQFSIYTRSSRIGTRIQYEPFKNCLNYTQESCAIYPFNLAVLNDVEFDPSRRTIVITHGYWAGAENVWQLAIKNFWLELDDVNVIIVSWTSGNHNIYDQSVLNTRIVARQISALIYYLAQLNNADIRDEKFLQNFYLVGHSLGAHISGFVGKDFYGKMGRIIGLDPAGPRFKDAEPNMKLNRNDALLVEAIHTNGGDMIELGHLKPLGHVDYYVNGGKHQPGCFHLGKPKLFCSHKRAPLLYAAFLEQEIAARQQIHLRLSAGLVPASQIYAFRANSYEEYSNGSFAQLCSLIFPGHRHNSNRGDENPIVDDMRDCAIRMDFVSPLEQVIESFTKIYKIDTSSNMINNRKYYFDTVGQHPFLNPTHLIMLKFDETICRSCQNKCSISLKIRSNESEDDIDIEEKSYNLIEDSQAPRSFYFVKPFLSSSIKAIKAMADLERNFILNPLGSDHVELIQAMQKLFPETIAISASKHEKKSSNPLNWLMNRIFNSSTDDTNQEDQTYDRRNLNENIISLSVQPLKPMDRLISVAYFLDDFNKSNIPSVRFVTPGEEYATKDAWSGQQKEKFRGMDRLVFSQDTIIIGPPSVYQTED